MGEHKQQRESPKGYEYRRAQQRARVVRARYVQMASPSEEYYERRWPEYAKRRRELKKKQAEAERMAKQAGEGKDAEA